MKTRKNLFSSESAAATVIAAVLLLSIIFTLFAVVRIAYVPEWKTDAEQSHMSEVQKEMTELKSTVDMIAFLTASNTSYSALPPVTVPFSMGGGEIPILEPSKSSGTLSVNNEDFTMVITPKNLSGITFPQTVIHGGITYRSNNREYVDQIFRYENGALILDQGGRSVMKQSPSFSITNNNGHYNFFIPAINIKGNNDTLSSNNDASLSLNGDSSIIPYSGNIDSFDCIITTKYPNAWKSYFNEDLNETAKKAGLEYGTDFYISPYDSHEIYFNFTSTGGKKLDGIYISKSDIKAEIGIGSGLTYPNNVDGNNGTGTKPPVSGFGLDPQSGCAPADIQITDISQYATSYIYDFGDGTPVATEAAPKHTYTKSGTFTVTQTVTNSYGTEIATDSITIRQMPIADFRSNVSAGEIPLAVKFTDASQFATGGVSWDFGDGSAIDTSSNPTHVYTNPGTYTITLTASNWVETSLKTGTLVAQQMPRADFSVSTTSGYAPLSTLFTDLSENAAELQWDFGDGSSSTETNPEHLYLVPGNYTAKLTAINGDGQSTKTSTINVKTSPQNPVAGFTAAPISGNAPLQVTFTDTSTGSPTDWNWDFGDGVNSKQKDPKHTYSKAGKYTVILTVSNGAGSNTAAKPKYITVS